MGCVCRRNLTILTGAALTFSVSVQADASKQLDESASELIQQSQYIWLDQLQREVQDSLKQGAMWIDSWGRDHDFSELGDDPIADGSLRLSVGWEPRDGDYHTMMQRVRLKLNLPTVKKRFSVVFSGQDEGADGLPENSSVSDPLEKDSPFDFSLRWSPRQTNSGWSHRIGFGRRSQIYARTSYQAKIFSTTHQQLNWQSSVSYYNRDRGIMKNQFRYQYRWSDTRLLEFENIVYYQIYNDRWLWRQTGDWFYQQQQDIAWKVGFYVDGEYYPDNAVDEYLVSVRRRKNAIKKWLYFDFEPFVVWRRDEDYHPSLGVALRIHAYF